MAARDRWHQLAGAIGASNLAASDKSVFRYLLDRADYATAELPPKFTPKQASIAKQTSHSIRQVKYAIGHLRPHARLHACPRRRVRLSRPGSPARTGATGATGATRTGATGAGNGCNVRTPFGCNQRVQRRRSDRTPDKRHREGRLGRVA